MNNAEYAQSLRLIADFYESNPRAGQLGDTLTAYVWDRKKFIAGALELSRGGRVIKSADDPSDIGGYYHAKRTFGGITVDVKIPRETVCRLISPAVYDCPDSLLEEAAEYASEVQSGS